ncbi:integral membrane [Fusarium longipes]|uniref:Integral membrane n=1 Tax=Fusarium longipes TaxID=694270 RepID=A0A395S284_9HYPO|nr:integral membrane [Fusarium longipes]
MASGLAPAESNAMQIHAPSIVFFLVTPLFIAFRFWSRVTRRTGLGWDDMTIIISFSCAVAVQTIMMVACNYGFGQHIKTLTASNTIIALKLYYVAQIFYKLTINLAKISMLLLYLRIFVHRWFRRCCFTLMGLVTCYMIAAVALSILQCYPISGAWDKSTPPTCISLEKFWLANAGFSIAADTLILMLPMHPICTSKLSVPQKRGLIMLLTTGGGLVIATSIVRMTTLSSSANTSDTTFEVSSTMWTIIEQNLAIICTCLPMCRLPIATRFPLWASETESSVPDVSQPADPSKHQTRRWSPYTGPRNVQGITRSIVITNDETSDEVTLDPVERTFTMSTMSSDIGAIRKIVEYQVTFETTPEAKP